MARRYMPIRTDKGQAFEGSLPCEGGCLVFELSSSVFVPGAKCWSEVCKPQNTTMGVLGMVVVVVV